MSYLFHVLIMDGRVCVRCEAEKGKGDNTFRFLFLRGGRGGASQVAEAEGRGDESLLACLVFRTSCFIL